MLSIKKNDIREGKVIDLTHEGHGVVKVDRYPIFVPYALIDEEIQYKVIKVKKNFAIGKLLEVTTSSKQRVEPPCIYYSKCGGCQLQHMNYEAQLSMKKSQVINLFNRKGNFKETPIKDVIGMEDPWYYRNKSQLPVGRNKQDHIKLGFFRQRSHDIIDMEECLIQDSIQNKVMVAVKKWLDQLNVSVYNEQRKRGLLRHLIIRTGHYTNEMMIIFVINGYKFKQQDELISKLTNAFPQITSIKLNINQSHSNVIMGKESITLYGKQQINDLLSNVEFKISDQSFYQINTVQTEKLYRKAIEYAGLTGNETVLDTYCGIGTIGLYMAPKAKHVYGVEVVPEAIEDAKINATRNQYENTTFVCGKAEEIILKWKKEGIKPDVVMVDPPRKGCDEKFIETLLELAPEKIIYISCNPATQQRDAERLSSQYNLNEITPVDMFPHTTHVETVAQFIRQ
ncbi:23S rRNA (uracil(1939)-C(5))-methyltransferase RlmD [Staphylococcus sp. SQ8-PEA]|uniref:23S rRNA (Uracil(1939)-C(5))-methyltransferase RlmD n=1 Tax=Staphylococcus marylandisciuri TaxID=2981529 RepID=A0ABT2QQF5_9STAP|nr:23S rRNA (uracil(1939)-C(5))-methyltransferase RlmD [Staphylococcus marylandisciuri]MCU5746209.1 23S rRNA (uracil(1939)-C(5))-methyltransferase RlmD [Staphylococcus marylandisciuri]